MSVVLPAKCGEKCHDRPHILRDVTILCTLRPGHADWHYDGVANHRWPLAVDPHLDEEPR